MEIQTKFVELFLRDSIQNYRHFVEKYYEIVDEDGPFHILNNSVSDGEKEGKPTPMATGLPRRTVHPDQKASLHHGNIHFHVDEFAMNVGLISKINESFREYRQQAIQALKLVLPRECPQENIMDCIIWKKLLVRRRND